MQDGGRQLPLLRRSLQPHRQPPQPRYRRRQVAGTEGKGGQHTGQTSLFGQDGKISLTEGRVLWLLGLTSSVIVLCDLIVVIWVELQTLHTKTSSSVVGLRGGVLQLLLLDLHRPPV